MLSEAILDYSKQVCGYRTAVMHVCYAKGSTWSQTEGERGNAPALSGPRNPGIPDSSTALDELEIE